MYKTVQCVVYCTIVLHIADLQERQLLFTLICDITPGCPCATWCRGRCKSHERRRKMYHFVQIYTFISVNWYHTRQHSELYKTLFFLGSWNSISCLQAHGSLMALFTPGCPGWPQICCRNWCDGPASARAASSRALCHCCRWRNTASCTSSWRTSTRPWSRWRNRTPWYLFLCFYIV